MSTTKRVFRSAESLEEEQVTRNAIPPFLGSRGYLVIEDERVETGNAVQQFITAQAPNGETLKMRVRLCWRRGGRTHSEKLYSAAQLAARPQPEGWDATLDYLVDRDRKLHVTHNLVLQRDESVIIYAALIPVDEIGAIWRRQREVSDELIRTGQTGRVKQNHAENGNSPTLYLQDDRTPPSRLVADALWRWNGVLDMVKLPVVAVVPQVPVDDTFDDCPSPDFVGLGRDAGQRVSVMRSEVKRDPLVRRAVLQRAAGACERKICGARRDFEGFLDVHHILGVEKSDRVYNCVALCPSCHREAHFAPYAQHLNEELLEYAQQFIDGKTAPAIA